MRTHTILQVDAFTRTPLAGNGCAVVIDADDLGDEIMQALARETNQAETVFISQSETADFAVRYFTPAEEIPMAGHPTIAAAYALVELGILRPRFKPQALQFATSVGNIKVELFHEMGQVESIRMTQKKPRFLRTYRAEDVLPVFGLKSQDAIAGVPLQTVSTGTPQLMVPIRNHDALRRAEMDLAAYDRLKANGDFFNPHLFALGGADESGHTFARDFGAPPDLLEDPFTGSATGGMAAYLWHYNLIEQHQFKAQQGHWMGRPGEAQVEVIGPRHDIECVRISGAAVAVMRGQLFL